MDETMRDDELISKRELLSKYGISYGALYRWKRKGLIPEDWFIKRSTTGQETFFPRAAICERMELILEQKNDTLLDELAKKLVGNDENDAIIIHTVFGDKTFYFRDITGIDIAIGKNKREIFKEIRSMAEKTTEKEITK